MLPGLLNPKLTAEVDSVTPAEWVDIRTLVEDSGPLTAYQIKVVVSEDDSIPLISEREDDVLEGMNISIGEALDNARSHLADAEDISDSVSNRMHKMCEATLSGAWASLAVALQVERERLERRVL
jgi:hypothetical protein